MSNLVIFIEYSRNLVGFHFPNKECSDLKCKFTDKFPFALSIFDRISIYSSRPLFPTNHNALNEIGKHSDIILKYVNKQTDDNKIKKHFRKARDLINVSVQIKYKSKKSKKNKTIQLDVDPGSISSSSSSESVNSEDILEEMGLGKIDGKISKDVLYNMIK